MSRDPFPRDADESLHMIASSLEALEEQFTAQPDLDLNRPPIGWAVLELLGHRRELGYVTEEKIAGVRFLRLMTPVWDRDRGDWIPAPEVGSAKTIFISTQAVYAITPSTERAVRDEIAPWIECGEPAPVQVEGSDTPRPAPCLLRKGHDGDHDPDDGLPF